ncbi:MAG: cysteine desulfurase [Thermoplasmata archaeon]|nr:MAG: cysteine desulfurase [Thermoplasmata archaeon]
MEKIYLDYASATPVDPRVLEFAKRFLMKDMGNASSLHSAGLGTRKAIVEARTRIAELINAESENDIIFTSGATESNNLAIKGTAMRNTRKGKKVMASVIEHISVLNSMKELSKNGFEFGMLPVDSMGIIDLDQLKERLTDDTTVVSIMYANNEIGTIEPIKAAAKLIHEKGGFLHVDATAAAGKIPIDVQNEGIDLLTISSNDMYGPQGVGALYIKPGIKPQPFILGGGQERGFRSGTENLFGIAGMGEAARLAKEEMAEENGRLQKIRDQLIEQILEIENTNLTGHRTQRLPHHASFTFGRIEGESILLNMNQYNIQIATGSACTSRTLEASHVLLALGLKHEEAHGSMIISLGKSNSEEQIPHIVKAVRETIERLRAMSPL